MSSNKFVTPKNVVFFVISATAVNQTGCGCKEPQTPVRNYTPARIKGRAKNRTGDQFWSRTGRATIFWCVLLKNIGKTGRATKKLLLVDGRERNIARPLIREGVQIHLQYSFINMNFQLKILSNINPFKFFTLRRRRQRVDMELWVTFLFWRQFFQKTRRNKMLLKIPYHPFAAAALMGTTYISRSVPQGLIFSI